MKHDKNLWQFSKLTAISIGAIADRLLLNPLDNLITIQQSNKSTITSSVYHMNKRYGWQGYYRGMALPFFLSAPNRIAMYWTYYAVLSALSSGDISQNKNRLLSGCASGVVESLIACPIDMYRITKLHNRISTKKILSISKIYRGLSAILLRAVVGNTITLAGSDLLCDKFGYSPIKSFLAGVVSGAGAQIIATPLDVVKTRMMCDPFQKQSTMNHIKAIWHEKSFFKGAGLRIARISLGSGVMIGVIKALTTEESYESISEPSFRLQ